MVVIHVVVKAKGESAGAFEQILRSVVADARLSTGCMRYEWYRAADQPHGYTIYGEFESREQFATYLGSSVVQRIGAELWPLLAAEPEFSHFEATRFEGSETAGDAQPHA
jgi:quinol monooxygenase YgiN